MKIFITGGCGFIGSNLISFLLSLPQRDISVRVFDRSRCSGDLTAVLTAAQSSIVLAPNLTGWDPGVSFIEGDVCDLELLKASMSGAEFVVHLAAQTGVQPSIVDPLEDCQVNVVGTLNVLEASRQNSVKKVIVASSSAPIGDALPPFHEGVLPKPISPYGASKLSGEAYCQVYNALHGMECVALRFSNVYGPFSAHKKSVVASFIKSIFDDMTVKIFGDGSQTRDFLYVKDLCLAIWKSINACKMNTSLLHIASGKETSVNELLSCVLSVASNFGFTDVSCVYVQRNLGDVVRSFCDVSQACERIDWLPETSLYLGVEDTFKYFLKRNKIACG